MILIVTTAALLSLLLILPWLVIIFGPICILLISTYPVVIGMLGVYRWFKKPLIIILDPIGPTELLVVPLVPIKLFK